MLDQISRLVFRKVGHIFGLREEVVVFGHALMALRLVLRGIWIFRESSLFDRLKRIKQIRRIPRLLIHLIET